MGEGSGVCTAETKRKGVREGRRACVCRPKIRGGELCKCKQRPHVGAEQGAAEPLAGT